MKVLITGAAGYLGQILYSLLKEQQHNVVGMDNFLYDQEAPKEIVRADITSLKDMYRLTKGVDVVVALAGIVGDPACGLDEEATKVINWESTKMLVDVCETNKVKKLIFASSCSVYGASPKVVTEYSPLNPLSLYAISKVESEKIIMERCQTVRPIILRFATLFGWSPRMRFDLVVNIMTAMAIKEGKIVVNGGEQWRPLVHIRDVAKTINRFIDKDPDSLIYNLVGENYKIKEIAQVVSEITGAQIIEKQDNVDRRDYNAISYKLNFDLKISVRQGVEEIKGHFNNKELEDYKDDKYYNIKILQTL
jgi:nucleoside-diphosphate-sugar epimerase